MPFRGLDTSSAPLDRQETAVGDRLSPGPGGRSVPPLPWALSVAARSVPQRLCMYQSRSPTYGDDVVAAVGLPDGEGDVLGRMGGQACAMPGPRRPCREPDLGSSGYPEADEAGLAVGTGPDTLRRGPAGDARHSAMVFVEHLPTRLGCPASIDHGHVTFPSRVDSADVMDFNIVGVPAASMGALVRGRWAIDYTRSRSQEEVDQGGCRRWPMSQRGRACPWRRCHGPCRRPQAGQRSGAAAHHRCRRRARVHPQQPGPQHALGQLAHPRPDHQRHRQPVLHGRRARRRGRGAAPRLLARPLQHRREPRSGGGQPRRHGRRAGGRGHHRHHQRERHGAAPVPDMGMAIVAIDRHIVDLPTDSVVVDNESASHEAVTHLVRLGHRRIAIVGGPSDADTARERMRGYERALREARIAIEPELVCRGDFRETAGLAMTRELLDLADPPSAIFAVNNLTTIGVLGALRERGVSRCPGHVRRGLRRHPHRRAPRPAADGGPAADVSRRRAGCRPAHPPTARAERRGQGGRARRQAHRAWLDRPSGEPIDDRPAELPTRPWPRRPTRRHS